MIGLYTRRKHFNRKAAFAFTVVPATLAAVATIAIGASEKLGNKWLPIVAMIATGVASILGAWESLFSNRKLWRVNNLTLTSLFELRTATEYRQKADEPVTKDEAKQYFERLNAIIAEGEKGYARAVGNE